MSNRWPEIGSTIELIRDQDADLALAHELMRERARLEQEFVDGLRALVETHKPRPGEANREYSRVLITAFEQEIRARSSDLNPNIAEYPIKTELLVGSKLSQAFHDAHRTHDDKYKKLLASTDELKEWLNRDPQRPWEMRMPLSELEYRLSVHHQRKSASSLQEWYETKLPPLIESHHSVLEDTKTTMINTINTEIDCASTCSRIYSRALGKASDLLPLNHRASIQEKMDAEPVSQALIPVDYYNWFFDGKPSPLHFGIGTLLLRFSSNFKSRGIPVHDVLWAERSSDASGVSYMDITLFDLVQYGPVLPLNSREFERLKHASTISRGDLIALLVPDEPVWEPLGSARRKELLKMTINKVRPDLLTFRYVSLLAQYISTRCLGRVRETLSMLSRGSGILKTTSQSPEKRDPEPYVEMIEIWQDTRQAFVGENSTQNWNGVCS